MTICPTATKYLQRTTGRRMRKMNSSALFACALLFRLHLWKGRGTTADAVDKPCAPPAHSIRRGSPKKTLENMMSFATNAISILPIRNFNHGPNKLGFSRIIRRKIF